MYSYMKIWENSFKLFCGSIKKYFAVRKLKILSEKNYFILEKIPIWKLCILDFGRSILKYLILKTTRKMTSYCISFSSAETPRHFCTFLSLFPTPTDTGVVVSHADGRLYDARLLFCPIIVTCLPTGRCQYRVPFICFPVFCYGIILIKLIKSFAFFV